jgi:transcription elongation factor GreA
MTADAQRRPGASELLKSLGLLVDGPQVWNRPVPSRAPGIYVIELPKGLPDAPVDIVAVRRWLEHVPQLMLDGERPTPEAVAKRMHEFWLADEPVLFVGRSQKAVGARVAAMYATPLGDARPYSGGHWLRTLSVLNELRVWWAETDAHEEYEDGLLSEIAARNATDGSGAVLPFANLVDASGVPKAHGLSNSLLTAAADPAPAAKPGAKKAATRARTTSATSRARSTTTRSTTALRKVGAIRTLAPRPTTAPTLVSQEGLDKLNSEIEDLRTVQRPQIIDRVATARSHGDLKENAEYEYARKEQSLIEGRIQMLEQMIRSAQVIDTAETSDSVRVGSTVDVESDGDTFTYQIVGSTEANPAAGKLSNNSPVGRALIGSRAGDEVTVELPAGSVVYRVVAIR